MGVLVACKQRRVNGRRSRGRLWLRRAIASLLGAGLLLAVIELTLRLAGVGHSTDFFVKASVGPRRSWYSNGKYQYSFYPSHHARPPLSISMPDTKDPGTFRIFVVGESAALGDPAPSFSFARVLEVMLRRRHPRLDFQIVNVSLTAINSNVLVDVVGECANHEPDLFLIYMGNNEAIGPFSQLGYVLPAGLAYPWVRLQSNARNLRSVQLVRSLMERVRPVPAAESFELLVAIRTPLQDPRLAIAHALFKRNLHTILESARSSGASVLLATVACNLQDWEPFASAPSRIGDQDSRVLFDSLLHSAAKSLEQGRPDDAEGHLARAARIEPDYADLVYLQARCDHALGRKNAAIRGFRRARDLDTLRFRADSQINAIVRETATLWRDRGVRLIDVESILDSDTDQTVAGDESFVEHVHLTFHGNYLIAKGFLAEIEKLPGLVGSDEGVPSEKQCADDLGYTAWGAREVADVISNRLTRPLFAGRRSNLRTLDRWRACLNQTTNELMRMSREEVLARANRACAVMPNDGAVPLNFADFLRFIGAGVESESFYRVAIAKSPWLVAARLKFALLLEHSGKVRDAVQQLEEAAACYPRDLLLPETLAEIESQRGRIFAAQRRVSEAEPCLRQAERLAGRSETILTTVGIAWATLNEPLKARAAFQHALTIDPNNVDALYNLGLLDGAAGELDGAIEHFDTLLAKRPDHELAALSLAQLMVRQNDYSRAAHTLDRTIKSRVGSPALLLQRGIVSEHMGEYVPAIGFYEAAIGLRPGWAVARARLALLLAASPNAAARDGSRALKIVLATKPISSTERFMLADAEAAARADLGDYGAAEAAASRAIEITRSQHRADWERLETSRLRLYSQKRPLRIQHSASP